MGLWWGPWWGWSSTPCFLLSADGPVCFAGDERPWAQSAPSCWLTRSRAVALLASAPGSTHGHGRLRS
jgi:hypothetical protein